ncbi:MAG: Uma2 family endonuclease [Pirellulales bacterium]|nr:Uma2 family endonuclease [Pirellulales bacterium]
MSTELQAFTSTTDSPAIGTADTPAAFPGHTSGALLQPRQFTVEEYHRMGEVGILDSDERVELLVGEIIKMCPLGYAHIACVNMLNFLLVTSLGNRAIVSVQNSVRLNTYSEPEPDVAIFHPPADVYRQRMPAAADVSWLIEVADSSLLKDIQVKLPLYAAAGIPEVWIVNLVEQRIEVYTQPVNGAYQQQRSAGPGEAVAPQTFADVRLSVNQILGL